MSETWRLARPSRIGTSLEQAQGMLDTMTATAAHEGLDFHFERAVPANTVDAHQAMLTALEAGDAEAYRQAVHAHYLPLGRVLDALTQAVRVIPCRSSEKEASAKSPSAAPVTVTVVVAPAPSTRLAGS